MTPFGYQHYSRSAAALAPQKTNQQRKLSRDEEAFRGILLIAAVVFVPLLILALVMLLGSFVGGV
jgi:hypothetical protein